MNELQVNILSKKKMIIFTAFLGVLLVASSLIFGVYVFAIAAVSYGASLTVEILFARFRKKELDYGWMVTPLIFTLFLPPTLPLWMAVVGSSFGTFFGKSLFGGLGKNIFNPAVVGVLFITISFPADMATTWLDPISEVIKSTTPLIELNSGAVFNYSIAELMIGQVSGALGETFKLGIIVLGLALIVMRIIDWRIPVFYLGSVFVFTYIGHMIDPATYKDPVLSLMVGGVMFAAFFVATDPVTSPELPSGRIVYAIGLGIITVIIRYYAAFSEGVIFAVIIMNAVAPLIDGWNSKADSLEELKEGAK
ncbi:MAG: RnfABCDGE type electron transport complex subunit D [Candidatus Izemoplasmataceae bacterium]